MDSLWFTSFSPDFNGSSSVISFENGFGAEEDCDDDGDRSFLRSGKKRRLSGDQVRFLEKSFESENKLEPERKARFAKELGLEPKQVAIWFQNRRARFKTKRLEKDHGLLKSGFEELGLEYDDLAKEVEKLREEVKFLKDKLSYGVVPKTGSEVNAVAPVALTCKQEGASSAKSDVLDSDGSDYAARASSMRERTADSSRVFESDVDDDDSFSRSFLPTPPTTSYLSKLEENPRDGSCDFGLNVDDQIFCFWP